MLRVKKEFDLNKKMFKNSAFKAFLNGNCTQRMDKEERPIDKYVSDNFYGQKLDFDGNQLIANKGKSGYYYEIFEDEGLAFLCTYYDYNNEATWSNFEWSGYLFDRNLSFYKIKSGKVVSDSFVPYRSRHRYISKLSPSEKDDMIKDFKKFFGPVIDESNYDGSNTYQRSIFSVIPGNHSNYDDNNFIEKFLFLVKKKYDDVSVWLKEKPAIDELESDVIVYNKADGDDRFKEILSLFYLEEFKNKNSANSKGVVVGDKLIIRKTFIRGFGSDDNTLTESIKEVDLSSLKVKYYLKTREEDIVVEVNNAALIKIGTKEVKFDHDHELSIDRNVLNNDIKNFFEGKSDEEILYFIHAITEYSTLVSSKYWMFYFMENLNFLFGDLLNNKDVKRKYREITNDDSEYSHREFLYFMNFFDLKLDSVHGSFGGMYSSTIIILKENKKVIDFFADSGMETPTNLLPMISSVSSSFDNVDYDRMVDIYNSILRHIPNEKRNSKIYLKSKEKIMNEIAKAVYAVDFELELNKKQLNQLVDALTREGLDGVSIRTVELANNKMFSAMSELSVLEFDSLIENLNHRNSSKYSQKLKSYSEILNGGILNE